MAAIFAAKEGGIFKGPPTPEPAIEPLTPAFKAEGPGLLIGGGFVEVEVEDAELGGIFGLIEEGGELTGAD